LTRHAAYPAHRLIFRAMTGWACITLCKKDILEVIETKNRFGEPEYSQVHGLGLL
jgi:hypothetical protein